MFPKRPIPRSTMPMPWYAVVLPVTMLPLAAFPPKVLPPPPLPTSLMCKDTVITPSGQVRLAQFNPHENELRLTRITWTPEGHALFLAAMRQLVDKKTRVVPTSLIDKMRAIAPENMRIWTRTLTKDQVRSHLSYWRHQCRQMQQKRELRSSDDKPTANKSPGAEQLVH